MKLERAIVIGGSIAGMLAAAVLAKHIPKVIILEKDASLDNLQPRKGVPQGRQVHCLLLSGQEILQSYFPGIFEELADAGAVGVDFCADFRFYHYGVWKSRSQSELNGFIQSRPLLELHIHKRLQNISNIEIRTGTAVEGFLFGDDHARILGVVYRNIQEGAEPMTLTADLVIDASGRGSRTPNWLRQANLPAPREEQVAIRLTYTSRIYERSDNAAFDWKVIIIYPKAPNQFRYGIVFPIENNHWLVGLAGYLGEHAGADADAFVEFAKSLPEPDIYNLISTARPLSGIHRYHIPCQFRRRYESLNRLPDGLIILGDAGCSLDPLFGQGMSIAALSVKRIDACLSEARPNRSPDNLCRQIHKEIAKIIDTPWLLTSSEAYRYPQIANERPWYIPLLQWYAAKVFVLSEQDHAVYIAFLRLMHLTSGLFSVFRPWLAWRILRRDCRLLYRAFTRRL